MFGQVTFDELNKLVGKIGVNHTKFILEKWI